MAADLNEKLMYVRGKGSGRIELLGHCVGAHVVGQAGNLFRRSTGDDIDKIIGSDTTGILLRGSFNGGKLWPTYIRKN